MTSAKAKKKEREEGKLIMACLVPALFVEEDGGQRVYKKVGNSLFLINFCRVEIATSTMMTTAVLSQCVHVQIC